jgi:hypothetical protein
LYLTKQRLKRQRWLPDESSSSKAESHGDRPHDDLAEDVGLVPDLAQDVLPVCSLSGAGALDFVLSANDGKRRPRRLLIVNVGPSRLKDAADEDDLEEGIRVLEELERRTGRYELRGNGVVLIRRDGEKVGEEGIPEDCSSPTRTTTGIGCNRHCELSPFPLPKSETDADEGNGAHLRVQTWR